MHLTIPLILVHSCLAGLKVGNGVLVEAWTQQPGRICTDTIPSLPIDWWWTSPDFFYWSQDVGQPCPFDDGWSYRVAIGWDGEESTIKPDAGYVMLFVASAPSGEVRGGAWAGPCDWNLNGEITLEDFFNFLDDYFSGHADFDLSGLTDSEDLFFFLGGFLS